MNSDRSQTIGVGQLAILYMSFTIGSSIVNIPNPMIKFAGNMAWFSILVSMLLGMLILWCVLYLSRCYPDAAYIDYLRQVYGRWVTAVVIIALILMLYLMLAYIILDIGSFFINSMMVETPIYIFNALTLIVAAYTAHAGIEVMGRMFLPLIASIVVFIILIICFAAPIARTDPLLPLFANGMKPILHGIYFSFGFPFAECFLFALILPFLHKDRRDDAGKWMFVTLIISGILLIVVVIMTIMTLGPLAGDRKYSLYAIARLIQIGQFVVGIEAVVGIALIAGSFMKAAIVLFILNSVKTRLLNMNNDKILLPAIAFVTFLLSLTMFRAEAESNESVSVVWPLMTMTVGIGPLVIAAAITFIKRKLRRNGGEARESEESDSSTSWG
jgi:spore germination protein KB